MGNRKTAMTYTLQELAARFDAEIRGDGSVRVDGVATLENAGPGKLAFLANSRYRRFLSDAKAAAVVLGAKDAPHAPMPCLVHPNPYALYARIAALFVPDPDWAPGVAEGAWVASDTELGDGVSIAPSAVVEAGAKLGKGVRVGPGCVVGRGVRIGERTVLTANVTVCCKSRIGRDCLIHPGVVIGADGFGQAQDGDEWVKVPQLGGVEVGDRVEIGANCTIDRGALDDTVIEDGVKLDNQIQIAHNVRVGANTVIAGCTAIAGSSRIGRNCMIAGGVGIAGHLEIVDRAVVTAMTLVTHSIRQPGVYSGSLPMDTAASWRRNSARYRSLDALAKRITQLEKQLKKESEQ